MASKDSQELRSDERYPLGDYSFRLERSSGTSPNYDKIEAICTKGGKNARKSIQVPSSSKMNGWYVEANETEATVYVLLSSQERFTAASGLVTNGGTVLSTNNGTRSPMTKVNDGAGAFAIGSNMHPGWGGGWIGVVGVSDSISSAALSDMAITQSGSATYKGHTVYACQVSTNAQWGGGTSYTNPLGLPVYGGTISPANAGISSAVVIALCDFLGVYWESDEYDAKLVGRFAIDIKDAGGDGPGSDWEDPGDYDPDWEEGDPTHTLYLTVTGALSGRHNDPIVDPSYSYIPTDKNTVKDYGCGGDGGHGGGGGAGASTVVVHKFATNQANSKEVTAIARRHGYGSGGGKGGKGGDGCILVYY